MSKTYKPINQIKKIKGHNNDLMWAAFPGITEYWITNIIENVVYKSREIYETKKYIQYWYHSFQVITTSKNAVKSLFLDIKGGEKADIKIQEVQEWKDGFRSNVKFEMDCGGVINAYVTDYLKNKENYTNKPNLKIKLSGFCIDGLEVWDSEEESGNGHDLASDFCGYSYIDDSSDLFEGVFIVEGVNEVKIFDQEFWKLKVRLVQHEKPVIVSLIANKNQSPVEVRVGDHYISSILFQIAIA
jgi:hypothetical protein